MFENPDKGSSSDFASNINRPMEGPIKSPLPVPRFVCPFGIFLRKGSLVFCDFWHDGR